MKRVRRTPFASIVKRFDQPDRSVLFELGRLELVDFEGRTIGKATYAPGWHWAHSIARATPSWADAADPVAVVLRGRVRFRTANGQEFELAPGDVFHVPLAEAADAWVIGYHPCEVLYVSGLEMMLRRMHGPA